MQNIIKIKRKLKSHIYTWMILSSLSYDGFLLFIWKIIFIDMINIYNFTKTNYTLYLEVNESL